MVFRTLTAGAFLVGAPPAATEPGAEPQLPPSSPEELEELHVLDELEANERERSRS